MVPAAVLTEMETVTETQTDEKMVMETEMITQEVVSTEMVTVTATLVEAKTIDISCLSRFTRIMTKETLRVLYF